MQDRKVTFSTSLADWALFEQRLPFHGAIQLVVGGYFEEYCQKLRENPDFIFKDALEYYRENPCRRHSGQSGQTPRSTPPGPGSLPARRANRRRDCAAGEVAAGADKAQ